MLDVNISWFCSKKFISDKMYWELIVSIPSFWNNGLHGVLGLDPVIIQITSFWANNTLLLSVEFPQKIIPIHYRMKVTK
jgi:hypothetical protein